MNYTNAIKNWKRLEKKGFKPITKNKGKELKEKIGTAYFV